MDLKAAFDRVSREKLWPTMEVLNVRKGLIERTIEIYEVTKAEVAVNGVKSEVFWQTEGVRQGCPISPLLFTIFIADMEKVMRNGALGRVKVGQE